MSKRTIIIIVVVVVGALSYYGYTNYTATEAEATPEPAAVEDLQSIIWASGKIVPAQWATLSAPVGGQVVELDVVEGDNVENGAILLRLDDADFQANIQMAESALMTAQAELARLRAAPRPTEIVIAEDAIRLAEADVTNSVVLISQAEAGLANALAQLDQAQAGLANAIAQRSRAEAERDRLLADPRDTQVQSALAQVKLAENALALAQTEYDKIAWAGEVSLTPQALALQSATLDYQVAQSAYEALFDGATSDEIAAAAAAVESAEAGVAQAEAMIESARAGVAQAQTAIQGAEARVTQAETAVEAAKHRRDLVVEGAARDEDIAVAEAAVHQAEVALAVAQNALDKTIVRAPFNGTVGTIEIRLGEQVLPGQALLTLASLDQLQVETTDLRETDVSRLTVGQAVDLTFDALPDALLTGVISRIASQSTSGQGGVNYTTLINFDNDELPPQLRWGMTAFVNIAVEE